MTTLSIPDMSCGHCKSAIETAVSKLDGAATLDFDMNKRIVALTSSARLEDILNALKTEGYPATVV